MTDGAWIVYTESNDYEPVVVAVFEDELSARRFAMTSQHQHVTFAKWGEEVKK